MPPATPLPSTAPDELLTNLRRALQTVGTDARARSKLERLLKCTTVPELRALYQELCHACSAMLAYDRAALREAVVEQLCRDRNRQ